MEFRILGPFEASDVRGEPVTLPGARERTLLGLLAVSPGRVVPTDRLVSGLWGDRPPSGAAHALQVHVSRLRRVLREAGADGVLATRAPGYLLQVDPTRVDAVRFAALRERGRDELRAGRAREASATLREALDLWRGVALEDLPDVPEFREEAARLDEARLVALEERVEADLACGLHAELGGELAGLTRAHPLRERLWTQRMLALYRSGRQAEALAAYRELHALLDDELGIEPGAEAVRLHAEILAQDPSLDPEPALAPTGSPLPMPPLLTEPGRVFVGREAELAELGRAWDGTGAGTAGLALVCGEPGVGKTRLAAELAGTVHTGGADVFAGRCDEDLGVPYQPFVEALTLMVARTDPATLRARLGPLAGELIRLVPEIAERVGDLPPPLRADQETERYRLFDAVAGWLSAACATRPVLLVLDDLQWATKPTLQLLRHVSRSVPDGRLLTVATYRDTELERSHPLTTLLADLRRQPNVIRLRLGGLHADEVTAFMADAAGHELAGADLQLARAIHAETEGNPFFVREVLRLLRENGKLDDGGDPARRIAELGVPDGVREVVGRRLSKLSEQADSALRVAAVIGPEFDLPLVAAAGDLDEEGVLTAVEEATTARLLVEDPASGLRHRFAHALVRATLLDELTGARRMAVHRRIALALEQLHGSEAHLPALALHWARAAITPADRSRAVDYAARAGDRAVAQLANDQAASWYRQAVDLLTDDTEPRRVDLLIALGEAQRRAGDPAHRQTLLAAAGLARSRGDAAGQARAAIANSPGSKPSVFGITDADRVTSLEQALDAIGPQDSAYRARLLAVLALELFHSDDRDRRIALSDDALATARRLGDPAILAGVLVARPFAIGGPDTLARRLDDTAELIRVAGELGDPVVAHRAWWSRFRVVVEAGDTAEADRCLVAEQELTADIRQPTLSWMTGLQLVARALRRGTLDDAEQLIADVHEQGRLAGQPDARLYHAIQLFQLRYEQGRVAEAEHTVRETVASSPELPAIRAALALLYAAEEQPDRARTLFDEIAGDDIGAITVEASTVVAYCFCAELCALLQDRERAARLYGLIAPYPDHVSVWAVGLGTGPVAQALGRLAHTVGDLDAADRHFAEAAAVAERADAPTWLARARLDHARVLRDRCAAGDAARAEALLDASRAAAADLGMRAVLRAATALRGAPADDRRSPSGVGP